MVKHDVLTYKWAYGKGGTALKDKEFLIAVFPGVIPSEYQHDTGVKYTIHDLLRPFQATNNLIHTKIC